MKPIFKEEINSKQALLNPDSLVNLQFQFPFKHLNTSNQNNILCISSSNPFQKLYLSCVLNNELDKNLIALPKWLSLTFNNSSEDSENVNVQLVDTSGNNQVKI